MLGTVGRGVWDQMGQASIGVVQLGPCASGRALGSRAAAGAVPGHQVLAWAEARLFSLTISAFFRLLQMAFKGLHVDCFSDE